MAKRVLTAVMDTLVHCGQPVIASHAVFCHVLDLYKAGTHNGERLLTHGTEIPKGRYQVLLRELVTNGTLTPDRDFHKPLYRIKEQDDGTADEICAIADPFCYLSHLSAMRRYGLTERFPKEIIFTSLAPSLWKEKAQTQMQERCGEAVKWEGFIPLTALKFPQKVRGQMVHRYATTSPAPMQQIRDAHTRIATIGATFHDMLHKPALCGGMAHVLDVWREHAGRFLEEIIPVVEASPHKIIQVRAGYILDEMLAIHDPRIEAWQRAAMRGGSRVLDPEKPFSAVFSEKWMLSLNVPTAGIDTA
jgi:predicted transcriptional regulator of viral defense system